MENVKLKIRRGNDSSPYSLLDEGEIAINLEHNSLYSNQGQIGNTIYTKKLNDIETSYGYTKIGDVITTLDSNMNENDVTALSNGAVTIDNTKKWLKLDYNSDKPSSPISANLTGSKISISSPYMNFTSNNKSVNYNLYQDYIFVIKDTIYKLSIYYNGNEDISRLLLYSIKSTENNFTYENCYLDDFNTNTVRSIKSVSTDGTYVYIIVTSSLRNNPYYLLSYKLNRSGSSELKASCDFLGYFDSGLNNISLNTINNKMIISSSSLLSINEYLTISLSINNNTIEATISHNSLNYSIIPFYQIFSYSNKMYLGYLEDGTLYYLTVNNGEIALESEQYYDYSSTERLITRRLLPINKFNGTSMEFSGFGLITINNLGTAYKINIYRDLSETYKAYKDLTSNSPDNVLEYSSSDNNTFKGLIQYSNLNCDIIGIANVTNLILQNVYGDIKYIYLSANDSVSALNDLNIFSTQQAIISTNISQLIIYESKYDGTYSSNNTIKIPPELITKKEDNNIHSYLRIN